MIQKRKAYRELRQLEYVFSLADEHQLTTAAALCQVSQSGQSAAIRNREDEMGTPLFLRTTRKVELTDAGMALLPFAGGDPRPRFLLLVRTLSTAAA